MHRPSVAHLVGTGESLTVDLVPVTRATRPVIVRLGRAWDRRPSALDVTYEFRTWSPNRMHAIMRAEGVRLVHAHDSGVLPTARELARRLGVPLVATIAGDGLHDLDGVSLAIAPTRAHAEQFMGADTVARVLPPSAPLPASHSVPRGGGEDGPPSDGVVPRVEGTAAGATWSDDVARQVATAQAHGTPVLTANPLLSELVPPEHRVEDVDTAVERANTLRQSGADLRMASDRARAFAAQRFERSSLAADLDVYYMDLIAQRRVSRLSPAPLERPRVSVVLSTYNRSELLRRALAGLAGQTYPSELLELIVVDNGSTDDTQAVLDAFDPPFDLIRLRNDVNISVAHARNHAVTHATGDLVAFTDDDCIPEPTWAEVLAAGFRPDVGIVQGLTRPNPDQRQGPWTRSQSTPFEYGLYETCNIAYRRANLPAAPPFPEDLPLEMERLLGRRIASQAFGEDVELAWRVKRTGVESRFAADAIVNHHVFPSDPGYVLRRSVLAAGFPVLVRRVPELRRSFLWGRVLLSRRRLLFWLAALGALFGRSRAQRAALLSPYALALLQPHRSGRRSRVKTASVTVTKDIVETAALAYGSARAKTPVL